MKRYWLVVALLLLFFLGMFLIVEQQEPSLLTDPYRMMNARSAGAALTGIGLLVADVILPVPSSLVMVANGALFGIALGVFLSLIGSLGAALVGFAIGRSGESWIARYLPPEERARAQAMLEKWGLLAIILTRPVPLLAETTAIMAGASTMQWRSMCLATLAGSLPSAILYAIAGATAVNWHNTVLTFGTVLMIAGLFWGVGRYLDVYSRHAVVDDLAVGN